MIARFKNINYNSQEKMIFTLVEAGYKVWIEKEYCEWPIEATVKGVYVCVELPEQEETK